MARAVLGFRLDIEGKLKVMIIAKMKLRLICGFVFVASFSAVAIFLFVMYEPPSEFHLSEVDFSGKAIVNSKEFRWPDTAQLTTLDHNGSYRITTIMQQNGFFYLLHGHGNWHVENGNRLVLEEIEYNGNLTPPNSKFVYQIKEVLDNMIIMQNGQKLYDVVENVFDQMNYKEKFSALTSTNRN